MRAKIVLGVTLAAMWGCGGQTFTGGGGGGGDGGTGSSSGSGSSSGGSGGSGGSGSSGGSGGSGSSGASSGGSGGSSGASSSGGGSGSSGSSSGGQGPDCPSSPPAGGTKCPQVGIQCEYGSNPNPSCNDIVSCESSGWSFPTPGPACPTGVCPGSYADAQSQTSCTPPGLDCAYAEGQCNCSFGPLPGTGNTASWYCRAPGSGCPEPRPDLGQACSQEGLSCDYGACFGGIALDCTGGQWVEGGVACPAMAGQ